MVAYIRVSHLCHVQLTAVHSPPVVDMYPVNVKVALPVLVINNAKALLPVFPVGVWFSVDSCGSVDAWYSAVNSAEAAWRYCDRFNGSCTVIDGFGLEFLSVYVSEDG